VYKAKYHTAAIKYNLRRMNKQKPIIYVFLIHIFFETLYSNSILTILTVVSYWSHNGIQKFRSA